MMYIMLLSCCTFSPSSTYIQWDAEPVPSPGFKAPYALSNGDILAASTHPAEPAGRVVSCYRSRDAGVTWEHVSDIVLDPTPRIDLGDGAFLERQNGDLLYVFRRNKDYYFDPDLAEKDHAYQIEVAISHDQGTTWQPYSVVKSYTGTRMGLWSPSLFERSDGTLQCYYDDEHLPEQNGFRQHQWAAMATWDPEQGAWVNPVVVSRAHNPAHLSRDGMCSAVELPCGRILVALESVQTEPPHRGCIRLVFSEDGGKTWSWKNQERQILHAPKNPHFNSLAPWLIRLEDRRLFVIFMTDEDRDEPGIPAIQQLRCDIKYVVSHDDGQTWIVPQKNSSTSNTIDKNHPLLFPGVCVTRLPDGRQTLIAQYSGRGRNYTKRGYIYEEDSEIDAP